FAPWVEEAQAARKGLTVPQYAASVATQWREGLASWGQDGDRIRRLKEAADFAIYTPGSSAGRPLTILRSFAAPPPAVRDDADALRDRVGASVAGLLGLVGVDADPLRSREHILLANLVERAWREGEDLDLGTLILKIQDPGFTRVGVMDLESFFPAKDRFGLAMTLNNLLASPGFASWIEGEPLDVQRLLYTPEGKPRIAIISIAHLSDAERMFF
ncbi:ATP-binding protein, partial [bacterium]|nr:ATP-binding protein [bacterium]